MFMEGPKIGAAYRIGSGNWNLIWETTPTGNIGPEQKVFEIVNAGQPDVQVCVFISGFLFYVTNWYIDDVKVFVPNELDTNLAELKVAPYVAINAPFALQYKVVNDGTQPITSFDISYVVDGGAPVLHAVSGVNIQPDQTHWITHPVPVSLNQIGEHQIAAFVSNVNGGNDAVPANNTKQTTLNALPFILAKKVLAEEATGTWCGWCTRGICFMDYMAETYPDTWIGVAIHNNDPMKCTPYDNAVANIIPGFMGYPMVTSDRSPGDSDPANLEAGYERRINTVSLATLDIVNFNWNPATRHLSLDLQSEFVAEVTAPLRFGLIITEDSLWGRSTAWEQSNAYAGGQFGPMCGFENLPSSVPAEQMHYDHVARAILDSPFGTPSSLPQPIAFGSIHAYTYSMDIPADWCFEKLNFIGFIVNLATKEIMNATNIISHFVNVNESHNNELNCSIFPNPANEEISILLDGIENGLVAIQLLDVTGKVIQKTESAAATGRHKMQMKTTDLANGTYLIKLQSETKAIVHKLVIQH
ncbi:hypothetical protein MASR2M12_12670 [Bacteroidales bacterium]